MNLLIHQNPVSFKLEVSKKVTATSFAGIVLMRKAMKTWGLIDEMERFGFKKAGFSDAVIVEALVLLIASGGRSLSDWEYLKGEMGFDRMFGKTCPSVDTLERYLRRLSLLIPERDSNAGQVGYTACFETLQEILILSAWKAIGSPKKMTLDLDAMIIETDKRDALYCYEKVKAYQPMNAYCPELGMVLAHEFRDGNVSPMEGYQRIIERCRKLLPQVRWIVRSDSAGYQNEFLDWMTDQRIAYVMTARETEALQAEMISADGWRPLILDGFDLGEEITEVIHCPDAGSRKELHRRMNDRRYLALRKTKGQQEIFISQIVVTNDLTSTEEKVVTKHRGRCGSIEHFHSQLKGGLGMDSLPSNDFKVNAAWYALGCLAHNLLRLIQSSLFQEDWKKLEIKTFRFRFLRLAALVISKARRVILKFHKDHPIVPIYLQAWERLAILSG
ncbi:MAG: IS1380 family transposase [Deltaproteobacteria bacterium]|nr:IS1380 family transposase [Deltaproteobacteria bacterium]